MPNVPRFPVSADGTKVCTKCGVARPVGEYRVKVRATGRLYATCIACQADRQRAYVAGNPEAQRERGRSWARRNPERTKENARRLREAHPERAAEYQAQYRLRHGGRMAVTRRGRDRARYAANPALLIERARRYRRDNADRVSASNHARYLEHRGEYYANNHRRRARVKANGGSWTVEEWDAIKAAQDYTCPMCGKREPDVKLTVDHIVPISLGGLNVAANLQGLCKPDNSRKARRILDLRKGTIHD